jgi:hypothetical protein
VGAGVGAWGLRRREGQRSSPNHPQDAGEVRR